METLSGEEEEEIDFDSQPLITTIAEIGKEEEEDGGTI